jgi:hypothetical protein
VLAARLGDGPQHPVNDCLGVWPLRE